MRNIFLTLTIALLTATVLPGAMSPAPAAAKDTLSEQPPADVWLRQVIAPCFSQENKVSEAACKTVRQKYISPELRKLLKADSDEAARNHEVGRLDYDWIVHGQDIPVKWHLGKPQTKGDITEVPVYTYLPIDKQHLYYMVLKVRPATAKSPAGWTIIDARYPNNTTLLGILKRPY